MTRSHPTETSSTALRQKAAFFVGFTGHRDLGPLDELGRLRRLMKLVLMYLQDGDQHPHPDQTKSTVLDGLIAELSGERLDRKLYRRALEGWKGFRHFGTPVVVLTSLAPGADSLAAETALEAGCEVRAVLPFSEEVYAETSTFDPPPGLPGEPVDEVEKRNWIAAARIKNLETYRTLLRNIRLQPIPAVEQVTTVYLADDIAAFDAAETTVQESGRIDIHELSKQRFRQDKDLPERRRRRYQGSSEYLAQYSHLLVAVWDDTTGPLGKGGSLSAVDARLYGPTFGLLPTTPPLALPHGGPLLHIATRRLCRTSETQAAPAKGMSFLYPAASAPLPAPEVREPHEAERIEWQRQQLDVFRGIMHQLAEFNHGTQPVTEDDASYELFKRLGLKQNRDQTLEENLQNSDFTADGARKLLQISAVRRRAGDGKPMTQPPSQNSFDSIATFVMRRLFWYTFFAALFLHVFTHWHPKPPPVPTAAKEVQQHHETDEHEPKHDGSAGHVADKHETPLISWQQLVGGSLSLLFLLLGTILFLKAEPLEFQDRGHDYRALAEGLRVQFFWHICGLGHSVPSNYMKRQRSELDWIRGAIRATATPYYTWRLWFSELSPAQQLKRLRCVHVQWVAEQWGYFEKSTLQNRHRLHWCHTLGGALAVSGIFVLFRNWLAGLAPDRLGLSDVVSWHFLLKGFGWWAVCPLIGGVHLLYRRITHRHPAAHKDYRTLWQHVLDWMLPNPFGHASRPHTVAGRLWRTLGELACGFPFCLGNAYIVLCLQLWFVQAPGSPELFGCGFILGGICLLGGAMIFAWGEKRLFSEHAYQFGTMLNLFHHAYVHMQRDLNRLQKLLERAEAEFDPDRQRELRREFAELIAQLQEFLYELGIEALDENAEWLILHRARPLEPVMAG